MKQKLVVIGNGMAGMRTVEELLKLESEMYDITVFGNEPHPNYNRMMLSPVLAGEKTIDDIILNSREWYQENGITLLTGDQEFDSPKTLAAFALGLMLFVTTLLLNVFALHIVRKYREQYE